MAEEDIKRLKSPFIKWQDMDGDGYIDICDDIEYPEKPICLPCIPNPRAIIPDWKNRDITEPSLNTKLCQYEVTVVTKYKTIIPEKYLTEEGTTTEIAQQLLDMRFEEYEVDAVTAMLDHYSKDDSPDSIAKVIDALLYAKYDLKVRNHSRLKLLYRVPHDVIFNLPDRMQDIEHDEPDPEEEDGTLEVTYDAAMMTYKNIRVRKALWLYGQYLKVYRALGEGNLFFIGDNPPPNDEFPSDVFYPDSSSGTGALGRVFNLADYGDPAVFTSSVMSDLMDSLEAFMNARGYNIPGVGGMFSFFLEDIMKMKFFFKDFKLVRLHIWTQECGANRPIKFNEKRLASLNKKGAWKDKTAVHYFTKLWPMEASLAARVPMPWVQFIEEFTYPKVKATFNADDEGKSNTAMGCVADALENELKELGQDLVDDLFGIGDAIAYKFNKNICRFNMEEVRADETEMGLVMDPNAREKANIYSMAQMQAYKKLNQDDQIFVRMCARILANATGFQDAQKAMDKMYSEGFERIGQCGLFDLLLEALNCLMGGLSLEEALNSILKAALEAMSIENFGELFVGLPPEKQDELDAIVKKKIEDGDLVTIGKPNKPWQKQDVIDEERSNPKSGPGENLGGAGSATASYDRAAGTRPGETVRTLAVQYDINSAREDAAPETMLSLYIGALLEVYSENLLELMDEINKFPGAQLIAHMLIAMDCPRPPLFNPSFMSWIKSIQLPFCRDSTPMRAPRLENPFKWIPKLRDILKFLWEAIKWAVQQALMQMLIRIMVKVCELIGDAICAALETVGDIVKSLPALATGRTTLSEVIRESLCGPDSDPKQVEDTVIEMMATMGVGGQAFSDRESVMNFVEDISSSATRKELGEWFLGRPPAEFLEVVDQLIEFEYPQFREALPNKRALARMGNNMGNLMPLDFRDSLENMLDELPENDLLPANPTLCATPEQLDMFKELRCQLLEGRATKEQCDVMYEELRSGFVQDLGDISSLMQNGLEDFMKPGGAGGMPVMVSTPGCDDGLFPFESPQQIAVQAVGDSLALEQLRISYAKDMMGNGGFLTGDSSWGLLNMAMSDTLGNPLTAHHRKAKNNKSYVNFATNVPNGGESTSGFFSFFQPSAGFSSQEGQFPTYVGEWLMRQFQNASAKSSDSKAPRNAYQHQNTAPADGGNDLARFFTFDSHNSYKADRRITVDWDDLDFNMWFGQGVDLLTLPDFGYNSPMSVDFANEKIRITQRARKGNYDYQEGKYNYVSKGGDMNLLYLDNAAGMRDGCGLGTNIGLEGGKHDDGGVFGGLDGSEWSYGFQVQLYMSDIEEIQEPIYRKPKRGEDVQGKIMDSDGKIFAGFKDTGVIANRWEDIARIKVTEVVNVASEIESPLAGNMMDQFTKGELIDLPNWIEDIPLLGDLLQAAINLITLPFSLLYRPTTARARNAGDGISVVKSRRFEFVGVDDGLDGFEMPDLGPAYGKKQGGNVLKWDNFPKTRSYFTKHASSTRIPQVSMLSELIGTNVTKTEYDGIMQGFFEAFAGEIARNEQGWQYGAKYDTLQKSDLDYLIPRDSGFVDGYGNDASGHLYEAAAIVREADDWDDFGNPISYEWRTPEDDDMIMGQSRDQYENGENARVIYLNPAQFGGSYTRPALHIKPIQYEGWMGLVDVWFPEMSPCKPSLKEMVDFGEVAEKVQQRYPKIPEDPRLRQDPDCAFELPYNRILSRTQKVGLQGVIESACRIYASTTFLKAIPTFSLVQPKFPENYSSLLSSYIVELMEEGMKDAQPAFWEFFSTFKDEEFWYAFLEMAVQYYGFLIDSEEITDPPPSVLRALQRLNNAQETYDYPWYSDLWAAKETGDAGFFESLASYRANKNLEFVRATEEDAKLVLKEIVSLQLEEMGNKLTSNLQRAGFKVKIWDLDWWLLMPKTYDLGGAGGSIEIGSGMTAGSDLHVFSSEVVEKNEDLPRPDFTPMSFMGTEWPGPYYTRGKTFIIGEKKDPDSGLEVGDEYVGYFHGHLDEAGDVVYMAGEYHSDQPHDTLVPYAKLVTVGTVLPPSSERTLLTDSSAETRASNPDSDYEKAPKYFTQVTGGNVIGFGDVADYESAVPGPNHRFAIEKYVNVDGRKMTWNQAKTKLESFDQGLLLSQVYPGTMENVIVDGKTVGIKGQMGVRYGLQFYYVSGGDKIPVTSVEIDALDLPLADFQPLGANSKLLWCLIYLLKDDPKYKLMMRYIFPIPKILSTLAIYNDMGFLSAIGEVTVGPGDYTQFTPVSSGDNERIESVFDAIGAFLAAFLRDGSKKSEWIPKDKDGNYAKDGKTPGFERVNESYSPGDGRSWGARSKPGRNARIKFGRKDLTYEVNSRGGSRFMDFLFGSDDPIEVTVKWVKDYDHSGNEGWASYDDRQPGFFNFDALFVTEWDSWDRKLLRNSNSRMKRQFRSYYYGRDWKPGDYDSSMSPGTIFIKNLRAALIPVPGGGMLPWWQRGRLRSSPFNADGKLCSKS